MLPHFILYKITNLVLSKKSSHSTHDSYTQTCNTHEHKNVHIEIIMSV